jgi:phosphohistidine swiveling domain-containing protein
MVLNFDDGFSIDWANPQDANLTWRLSRDHFPDPVVPLAQDVIRRFLPRTIFVNGYMFSGGPRPSTPPPVDIVERGAAVVWSQDYEPRSKAICVQMRSADYEAMTLDELQESLSRSIDGVMEVWGYSMAVMALFRAPTFALVEFCERELGSEGPVLAGTLLQGFENESAAAGASLANLADLAKMTPRVMDALREERFSELADLSHDNAFAEGFRSFLENYGWRPEGWGALHHPTWAEDPDQALKLIARYVADPDRSPEVAMRRAQQQRDEALAEVESRLSGRVLGEFRDLLAASQNHVNVNEGRAHMQLEVFGSLRVPCLALGKDLVRRDLLNAPEDAFFLFLNELNGAASIPGVELKEAAESRKEDFLRWETLQPPDFLGVPPDQQNSTSMQPNVRYVREGAAKVSTQEVIHGVGASRGLAKGPARILRTLEEADRLEPGDVLVCETTAPPWTPLFAIAAAVVTDTGGLLSHTAICAREYGIPCVVGTGTGTSRLQDGQLITVDGMSGEVRPSE